MLRYVSRETGSAAAHTDTSVDDELTHLMDDDDDDELFSSEHLDSLDSDASWPKKPKIR